MKRYTLIAGLMLLHISYGYAMSSQSETEKLTQAEFIQQATNAIDDLKKVSGLKSENLTPAEQEQISNILAAISSESLTSERCIQKVKELKELIVRIQDELSKKMLVIPSYDNKAWCCKENLDDIFSEKYKDYKIIYRD